LNRPVFRQSGTRKTCNVPDIPFLSIIRYRRSLRLKRFLTARRPCIGSSFFIIILLVSALTGCTASRAIMYDGPEVEPGKQAVIRGDRSAERKIVIIAVNGSLTTNFFGYKTHGWPGEVAVLPGTHNLSAQIQYPFSHLSATRLWVITEAGESYVIKSRSKGYAITIWIENERTGKIAGGLIQNDNEPKRNDCPERERGDLGRCS
jgi:hypothetical protein